MRIGDFVQLDGTRLKGRVMAERDGWREAFVKWADGRPDSWVSVHALTVLEKRGQTK